MTTAGREARGGLPPRLPSASGEPTGVRSGPNRGPRWSGPPQQPRRVEHLPMRTSVHVVRAQMRTGGSLEAARPLVGPRRRHGTGDRCAGRPLLGHRGGARPSPSPTCAAPDGALWLGASLSILALVAGVGSWVTPTPEPDRPQAVLLDAAAEPLPTPTPTTTSTPTGGAPRGARGLPVAPFTVEGGAVRIAQFDEEDAWAAICEAAMGDSDCLAWGIVASIECDLLVRKLGRRRASRHTVQSLVTDQLAAWTAGRGTASHSVPSRSFAPVAPRTTSSARSGVRRASDPPTPTTRTPRSARMRRASSGTSSRIPSGDSLTSRSSVRIEQAKG